MDANRRPGAAAATGAFILGVASAAVSAYWGLGGSAGLDTVGGALEEAGRAREPALIALLWVVVALKLVAAWLGPAVACSWPPRMPRRLVRLAAWTGAILLTVYGGLLTVAGLMVQADVVLHASADADQKALRWHAYFWDPWFMLWGVLLGVAVWRSRYANTSATRAATTTTTMDAL